MYWLQRDLTFDAESHTYLWKGIKKLSVSQILQSVGVINDKGYFEPLGYGEFAKRYEESANFGSAFHKIPPAIISGKNVKYPEVMEPWIAQLRLFLKEYPLIPICDANGVTIQEYPMYSVKYGYCGTPDFLGFNSKHEIVLVDWKTSAAHAKHYNWQTAAYAQLIDEVHKIKVKRRLVVRFTETNFYIEERYNKPEDFIAFNSCLNVLKMVA
jgi:hypothetical protein